MNFFEKENTDVVAGKYIHMGLYVYILNVPNICESFILYAYASLWYENSTFPLMRGTLC